MSSLSWREPSAPATPKTGWKTMLAVCGIALLFIWLGRQLFPPDPTGNLWQQAQRLERENLPVQALRLYKLIARGDSTSAYAPQALQREGDILTAQARRTGDATGLRNAAQIYEKLATTYIESPLAAPAFQTAGAIAMDDLHDNRMAARLYFNLLQRYASNEGYAAEATVRLGRIAIMNGQKERARELLQRVLQRYSRQVEPCAEAQYHLGVLYETLYHNRVWAANAYAATIRRYPQLVWAANARERLGLLTYKYIPPNVRRVLIRIPPLPQVTSSGTLLSALKPLLAARGLEFSDTLLLGMTLHPFVTGYNPQNPQAVVGASGEPAFNVAANAGLSTQTQKGDKALAALQEELDRGRPSAVYVGQWRLCIGYDSQLNQVFLAQPGGGVEELGVKEFTAAWSKYKALNTPCARVTLYAPDDKPQAATTPTPNPQSAPAVPQPTPTLPRAELLQTPTWEFAPPVLKPRDALRRTVRNAAFQLKRGQRDDGALLNGAALQTLADELDQLARSSGGAGAQVQPTPTFAPDSPVPLPEDTPTAEPSTEVDPPAFGENTATPPESVPTAPPSKLQPLRWKALSAWFGAPLDAWLTQRRHATAFLDEAANTLNAPPLKNAASAVRDEIAALEAARAVAPAANAPDTATTRASWRATAQQLRQAQAGLKRAADLMTQAAG